MKQPKRCGYMNALLLLTMLSWNHIPAVRAKPYAARSTSWSRASMDGIFRTLVKHDDRTYNGGMLGVISAPFSSDESLLFAKSDGITICASNLPLVNEGEARFHIARFDKAGAVAAEIAEHESNIGSGRLYDIETVPNSDAGPQD